jgi:hypothetical protein
MASTKPAKRNLKTKKKLGNKDLDMARYLHDAKSSLRAFFGLLELINRGYDFSTKEGRAIPTYSLSKASSLRPVTPPLATPPGG